MNHPLDRLVTVHGHEQEDGVLRTVVAPNTDCTVGRRNIRTDGSRHGCGNGRAIGTANKSAIRGMAADSKSGRAQTFLALTALGVVFGDIGTSPLYTFSTALNATGQAPGATQVLGIVSLTFWALMVLDIAEVRHHRAARRQ